MARTKVSQSIALNAGCGSLVPLLMGNIRLRVSIVRGLTRIGTVGAGGGIGLLMDTDANLVSRGGSSSGRFFGLDLWSVEEGLGSSAEPHWVCMASFEASSAGAIDLLAILSIISAFSASTAAR